MVTIVIPMRNEEKFVGKCLDSFLQQITGREDIEILCVDGMSVDNTRSIVNTYTESNRKTKLITNRKQITPAGINLGIRQSRGDFIVVASCHAKYAPDYIDKCLEVIDRTGADQVGGYMETLPGEDTPVGRAIAAATSCRFGVGGSMFRLGGGEHEVDTVPFGMYRRDVFDRVGLYDERLVRNQDIELNSRLHKAGGRIVISPEIGLSYYNRATLAGLSRQGFSNGVWNPYTVWLTGGGLSLRHFVPMGFVIGLIALTVGIFLWLLTRWILLCYVSLYLSVAGACAAKRARQTKASFILILWSFIVLHISYGLGSIWALITIPLKFPRPNEKHIGQPLRDRQS